MPLGPRLRRLVCAVAALAALACAGGVSATSAQAAAAKPAVPKTPSGLPRAIEDPAGYVPQDSCTPGFRPGTAALGRLLVTTYPDTYFGGNYVCGTDGTVSEHYEGRAVDWMASYRSGKQRAEVSAMLKWLLGTDSHGNKFAMARRLGVMYVIWDNRIWSSYDNQWAPYLNCAKTTKVAMDSYCHRNHVHISLDWNGAMGRTSFFSKRLEPATDFGPCRTKGLTWAASYRGYNPRGCAWVPGPVLKKGSSSVEVGLATYSGILLTRNATGPAVLAVQRAVKVPVTGVYDAATIAAVVAFQRAHHVPGSTHTTPATWLALIAAHQPHPKK